MDISQGIAENGVQVGNYYDKYHSRNPIVKYLMQGFASSLEDLVNYTKAHEIHEVGCGEGYWVIRWLLNGKVVRGSDFSEQIIKIAKKNAIHAGISNSEFTCKSIYDLEVDVDKAELVICCEVLEHLEYPEEALEKLSQMANPWLILSVPREPIWGCMNMARGKYLSSFGNTPGHIQRWSRNGFIDFVSKKFQIVDVKSPLPWTMLLCKKN